jgi:hypothetical protein
MSMGDVCDVRELPTDLAGDVVGVMGQDPHLHGVGLREP